jgi:hypothetical protein
MEFAGTAMHFCFHLKEDATKFIWLASITFSFQERDAGIVLILKRASASRSSGQWSDDDYDVLEDGVIVGRTALAASPACRSVVAARIRHEA